MNEAEAFKRWSAELRFAQKDQKFQDWLKRCEKIGKRYRDDRDQDNAATAGVRRFNSLWSNIQTLKPAVYGKQPLPLVERRFMDRDPVARCASMVLERTAKLQMEVGKFHRSVDQAVLEWLLDGFGQAWVRYEPSFEAAETAEANAEIDGQEKTADQIEEDGDGAPYQKLAYEKTCIDFVSYKDFLWGPAPIWALVPWVGRRSFLSRSEITERFGKEKAAKVTLDYTPDRLAGSDTPEADKGFFKKAEVWEIWNRADRTVYFIAPGTPGLMLEIRKDPLGLEGFWPCPEPLFATQTTDTIVPVPDYAEYQDQAQELDDLTNRIANLTRAVKAAGVYDASTPALQRLLQEGSDNTLIPVDSWAAFAEKGGTPGAISLLPMKEIAEVLIQLYNARAQVKQDLFEITGISDIVRGQGDPNETATAQRIKGQFSSLRLQDRQGQVARFCQQLLHIMAEIISEHFTPESLAQMSGYEQTVQDEVRKAVESVPPPPQIPEEAQQDPQQAQAMQMQAQQQHQMAQQQAAQQAEAKAQGEFQAALELLKSDRMRSFRIDIETDSTIEADAQADKQSAVELLTGTLQGLTNAGPLIAQAPELVKPIGDMLMFVYRRFRVGRAMEAEFEQAMDQLAQRLENPGPQPPNPEDVKAQAEMQKQQMETQRLQMQAQLDQQKGQQELEMERQRNAMQLQHEQAQFEMEQQKAALTFQIDREKLAIEQEKLALEERRLALESVALERKSALGAEADERKHALAMDTAEARAAQAQTPKETK